MLKRITSNTTLQRITSNRTLQRLISGNQTDFMATDLLREGVRINGTYISSRNVRVTGSVEGDLHVAGTLVIEEQGAVDGDVYAGRDIFVAGKVRGDLRCSGKVLIAQTAVISGCIYTKSLGIKEKAVIEGEIHMESTAYYENGRPAVA